MGEAWPKDTEPMNSMSWGDALRVRVSRFFLPSYLFFLKLSYQYFLSVALTVQKKCGFIDLLSLGYQGFCRDQNWDFSSFYSME